MKIPRKNQLMLPALQSLRDGEQVHRSTVRNRVVEALGLSEDDLRQTSGRRTAKQPIFGQRLRWALNSMKKAGLLEGGRGVYRISEKGRQALSREPSHADLSGIVRRLNQVGVEGNDTSPPSVESDRNDSSGRDPEEGLEDTLSRIARGHTRALADEILDSICAAEPGFLEHLAKDLLVKMGYGDTKWAKVTGGSGDGGIDGEIRQDEFGLDCVYVQAKRYGQAQSVGASALRNFSGALDAAGASKGVFITTASFSRKAEVHVKASSKQIALVDGEKLARLMIRHNVGVRSIPLVGPGIEALECVVKGIDESYFEGS